MQKIRFYDDVKAKHPGVMIIFRCGDFYETYCDDAVEASRILTEAIAFRKTCRDMLRTRISPW